VDHPSLFCENGLIDGSVEIAGEHVTSAG